MELILWLIGTQLVYGSLMLGLAILRLRPTSRNEGGVAKRYNGALRFLRRRPCGDDGMIWKECFVAKLTRSMQVVTALAFLCVVALMVYLSYEDFWAAFLEFMNNGYAGPGQYCAITLMGTYERSSRCSISAWRSGSGAWHRIRSVANARKIPGSA